MIEDPRLEYQKLIDQNNRFFSLIFFGGYSLIGSLFAQKESIAGFEIEVIVLALSGIITVICFMWESKIQHLSNQKKAVEVLARNRDRIFRDYLILEKNLTDKQKPKFVWNDMALARAMIAISFIVTAVAFAVPVGELAKDFSNLL